MSLEDAHKFAVSRKRRERSFRRERQQIQHGPITEKLSEMVEFLATGKPPDSSLRSDGHEFCPEVRRQHFLLQRDDRPGHG